MHVASLCAQVASMIWPALALFTIVGVAHGFSRAVNMSVARAK
jgi:hypothetical protein